MKVEKLRKTQQEDGSFGPFHSMSTNGLMTTEKALRRMYSLSFKRDSDILDKSIEYLRNLLHNKIVMPDRVEKVIPWAVFSELMFSAWLTLFNSLDEKVYDNRYKWNRVISLSNINGKFSYDVYKKEFQKMFGKLESRQRVIDPTCFYCVVLLVDCLNGDSQKAYFDYIMSQGIYYIYNKPLTCLPKNFDSKEAIQFLEAIKLASKYCVDDEDLKYVRKWLLDQRVSENSWSMINLKSDGIIFPKSKSWRKRTDKENDINRYLMDVLQCL